MIAELIVCSGLCFRPEPVEIPIVQEYERPFKDPDSDYFGGLQCVTIQVPCHDWMRVTHASDWEVYAVEQDQWDQLMGFGLQHCDGGRRLCRLYADPGDGPPGPITLRLYIRKLDIKAGKFWIQLEKK